ncbi:Aste57867_4302 [Aphanomyces stellatus]|uniref:Aste57867_4302 protein n=1 Tax=Aphanomyces stellatus TaxID=120398 RepID=A0A485KGG5_9STRA|nr:hypothetical protein As57867_004291 [Aphanomyces stellatus]VFT81417.1 Aste57867_4302 [Aphanomyces stellatus]
MLSIHPTKKPRKSYTLALKLNAIGLLQSTGPTELSKLTSVPIANLKRWKQKTAVLLAFEGNKRRKNLDGAGRPEEIPDTIALVAYMNKMRDNERALIWSTLSSDTGFKNTSKKRREAKNTALCSSCFNCSVQGMDLRNKSPRSQRSDKIVGRNSPSFCGRLLPDETAVYYDMPPNKIWAVRGGNSKISSGEKQSYRMTAVLSARANGEKLPILFIMRGQPGGLIERS